MLEPGRQPLGLALVLLLCAAVSHLTAQSRAFDTKELSEYRLTPQVFQHFAAASERIAAISAEDEELKARPLFTKEVAVLGDAPEMARELESRLSGHRGLAEALRSAGISAREYTTFALTLFGARLAHGFMSTGALRSIPKGVATHNVEFVATHHEAVSKVLQVLGVEAPS